MGCQWWDEARGEYLPRSTIVVWFALESAQMSYKPRVWFDILARENIVEWTWHVLYIQFPSFIYYVCQSRKWIQRFRTSSRCFWFSCRLLGDSCSLQFTADLFVGLWWLAVTSFKEDTLWILWKYERPASSRWCTVRLMSTVCLENECIWPGFHFHGMEEQIARRQGQLRPGDLLNVLNSAHSSWGQCQEQEKLLILDIRLVFPIVQP